MVEIGILTFRAQIGQAIGQTGAERVLRFVNSSTAVLQVRCCQWGMVPVKIPPVLSTSQDTRLTEEMEEAGGGAEVAHRSPLAPCEAGQATSAHAERVPFYNVTLNLKTLVS